MKKILFLGGLGSGGAEHQMVIIARLLKQDGYNVTYLCDSQSSFFQEELESVNIPIIKIKDSQLIQSLRLNIPYQTLQVGRIMKTGRYDTVISFVGTWNFINCFYANRKRTFHRAITGIRNNRDEVFLSFNERFFTLFEDRAYKKVSNSNNARIRFAELFPKLNYKLITIYNIVDLPVINSTYICRRDEKIHIIVPASYRSVKNPMGLLHGVAMLNKFDLSHLHIDWYGNINASKAVYEEMVAFILQHKLNDIIELHDSTTDIDNRINEADFVGLFSTSEGLPNAICEGMMLGKPVIMTRVSDYDVLVDDSNGFLCDADQPKTIMESLSKAANLTESKLKIMGWSSKEKAQSLFSADVVLNQWKQII